MNASNEHAVAALEPQAVWRFFAGIASTPRPSKHEEQIRAHVKATADALGFTWREDAVGNIVISVPASPGKESAPTVVLQGHLDMVCEKNTGTDHDFENDPIKLIIDRDRDSGEQIVRADGTTLGADNGLGLAMGLAVASSPDVVHGPLELLCTIDEEMGMTGAAALEPGFFKGKIFINLDSEEDDILYIGCAGGGDTVLSWSFDLHGVDETLELARVTVSGLRGGHSGGDVHENRVNANKLLAHTLTSAVGDGLRIATINGGSKRNAIAREASAVVVGPRGTRAALEKTVVIVRDDARQRLAEPNANVTVEFVRNTPGTTALSAPDTQTLLATIAGLPHGVLEVHPGVPGLIQTSNNVATISSETRDGKLRVRIGTLSRSSADGKVDAVRRQIAAIGRLASALVEFGGSYPGWQPNVDSPLLKTCAGVYQRLFGVEPTITAIHAGLECGIIGERIDGLDMVSLGPRITGAHSPDEQTYVASVEKSYRLLTAVLAELSTTN